MRIQVRYMAQLRRVAGTATEDVELPAGATIGALLTHLARRHDAAFGRLLESAGAPAVLAFVADEQAASDRVLGEADIVLLVSPMAGG